MGESFTPFFVFPLPLFPLPVFPLSVINVPVMDLSVMNRLDVLSATYGTGNWAADFSLLMLGISLLALLWGLLTLLRSRRRPVAPPSTGLTDRATVLGGRLEKLEWAMNESRTEILREVAELRAEVEALRMGRLGEFTPKREEEDLDLSLGEPEEEEREAPSPGFIEERGVQEVAPSLGEGVVPAREIVPQPESLSNRLQKSRVGLFERIRSVFSGKPKLDESMLEELEALLIASDLGIKTVESLIEEVRAEVKRGDEVSEGGLSAALKLKVLTILERGAPLNPGIRPLKRDGVPLVVMMVGVNGVGKTTTTAKLAAQWRESGATVLMVAADTFRAAAVDQLVTWGERIGVPVVTGAPEAKPGTVVFDALKRAKDEGVDVVIIDTAGRLHTKANLMQELEGVRNIADRQIPGAPHETVLVVDGTTGQNAIAQAREFNAAVPLTGLVITKLDGTPKGGVVVAIKSELGIPVRYIGVGESPSDLRPFFPRDFVEALFDTAGIEGADGVSAHGEVRRRRRRDTQAYD